MFSDSSTSGDGARVVDDPAELAALFGRDKHVHVYALADLEEPFWSASTWWRNGDAAVGLVGLPDHGSIVYAVSSADPDGTLRLVAEVANEIPPTLITGVRGISGVFTAAGRELVWHRGYHRFHLTNRSKVPARGEHVVSLSPDDTDEALALYGQQPGAAFFLPHMLSNDTFVGIRVRDELVAIAGTHVLSSVHDVAAIGAVFTHPDHRGNGYGSAVTAGVIERIGDRVNTIGLNTTDANAAARAIYLRMGFSESIGYEECELAN